MASWPVVQVSKVGVLQFWKSIPSVATNLHQKETPIAFENRPFYYQNWWQCFHLLIFPCLLQRMVLPLIVMTKKKLKKKLVKFPQFCNFYRALRKISIFKNCSSGIWDCRFSFSWSFEVFEAQFLINVVTTSIA